MITFSTLIIISALFVNFSANNQAKRFGIPKTRVNLMTMQHQCLYLVLLCLSIISGQILNLVIQVFYKELGVDRVFLIWWIHHLLIIILFSVVLNIWIFLNATQNFEEFNGFVAAPFPGQQSPRPTKISPRREILAESSSIYPLPDAIKKMKFQKTTTSSRHGSFTFDMGFIEREAIPKIVITHVWN